MADTSVQLSTLELVAEMVADIDLRGPRRRVQSSRSGPRWESHVANEVEVEYRRFLVLNAMSPDRAIAAPTMVDAFWHQHIIDTAAYARDCQTLFGRFLPHQPCGDDDPVIEAAASVAVAEARRLYLEYFPTGNLAYWFCDSIETNDSDPKSTYPVPSECYSTPEPHGG